MTQHTLATPTSYVACPAHLSSFNVHAPWEPTSLPTLPHFIHLSAFPHLTWMLPTDPSTSPHSTQMLPTHSSTLPHSTQMFSTHLSTSHSTQMLPTHSLLIQQGHAHHLPSYFNSKHRVHPYNAPISPSSTCPSFDLHAPPPSTASTATSAN
ncbi:hypothetical protein BDQ12DRAFT_725078 [Crucibulum laeve]|uniref:Uncharacterized protein n=1 Tax=Crucibulum laeve TaxID=68775 RepID=A0A5C3LXI7_9AGAR|nr:hypothetical protein BDQ12DRAFT_725078 [Crucibulum laeve]